MAAARPRQARACSWCGGDTTGGRNTCSDECAQQIQRQTQERFVAASSARMKELAGRADHPALTVEANRRRSETRRQQRAAELEWERKHPGPVDREMFATEVMPVLATLSVRSLALATGLSAGHCAAIKRGERVPHPRWWWVLCAAGEAVRG